MAVAIANTRIVSKPCPELNAPQPRLSLCKCKSIVHVFTNCGVESNCDEKSPITDTNSKSKITGSLLLKHLPCLRSNVLRNQIPRKVNAPTATKGLLLKVGQSFRYELPMHWFEQAYGTQQSMQCDWYHHERGCWCWCWERMTMKELGRKRQREYRFAYDIGWLDHGSHIERIIAHPARSNRFSCVKSRGFNGFEPQMAARNA